MLLFLNNAHSQELSFLTSVRLRELIEIAWLALASANADALLLVFDQNAAYEGQHFTWFKQRHGRFVYIDRVVVTPSARGQGLARALYERAFAKAAAEGCPLVGCEVNLDPPNPASDAFHAALGFEEVGCGDGASGKTVRYMARELAKF